MDSDDVIDTQGSLDGIERVMAIAAHPDDIDFGASGTVAAWTDAGVEVAYVLCTDGDAGGFDDGVTRVEMAAMRQREQLASAETVGVTDVTFLGYSDGRLEPTLELRMDIARQIRRFRPNRVLVQAPVWTFQSIYRSHPDHRAAGEAAMAAVYPDARNPYAFPELRDEGFEAWSVPETWITTGGIPGTRTQYVDITGTFDRKLAALLCHTSQHPDPDAMQERMRHWGVHCAQEAGWDEGLLAESFSTIDTR